MCETSVSITININDTFKRERWQIIDFTLIENNSSFICNKKYFVLNN